MTGNGDGSQDSIAALGHEQPRADATARSSLKTSSKISIATAAVVPDCRFSVALEPDWIAGAQFICKRTVGKPRRCPDLSIDLPMS